MRARTGNAQIIPLAHYRGAPEDKIEFDNDGDLGHTEHLHTLELFKQKETSE